MLAAYPLLGEFVLSYMRRLNQQFVFDRLIIFVLTKIFGPYFQVKTVGLQKTAIVSGLGLEIRNYQLWILGLLLVVAASWYLWRRLVLLKCRLQEWWQKKWPKTNDYGLKRFSFSLSQVLQKEVASLRGGQQILIGLDADKKGFFLNCEQRTHQTQLIGKTGSGKSTLIECMLFQDLLAGRGAVVVDGKGEIDFAERIYRMCRLLGRDKELRFFSLAYPDRSFGYNPLAVPAQEEALTVGQRVFSVFEMEEPYFRQQAEAYFIDLVQLLHGTGREFNFRDLYQCMVDEAGFRTVKQLSRDQGAALRIERQIERLGREAQRTLSGLESWLRKFSSIETLNGYGVDRMISIRSVIESSGIVYFQLPGALHQIYSSAVGELVLQDLQMEIARRQLYGAKRTYFPVYVDEFYNFAYEGFMDAINKGRSANMMWTLSHQSLSDLTRVSDDFAQGVWDNTRNKIILSQNNAELCEKIAKDIGTRKSLERTSREVRGAFWTTKRTGEGSVREVDEFIFNPNRIKALHPFGQGCFINDSHHLSLNLPYLNLPKGETSFFEAFGPITPVSAHPISERLLQQNPNIHG